MNLDEVKRYMKVVEKQKVGSSIYHIQIYPILGRRWTLGEWGVSSALDQVPMRPLEQRGRTMNRSDTFIEQWHWTSWPYSSKRVQRKRETEPNLEKTCRNRDAVACCGSWRRLRLADLTQERGLQSSNIAWRGGWRRGWIGGDRHLEEPWTACRPTRCR